MNKYKKLDIKSPPGFRKDIPPYRVFFTWDMTYDCNYKCSYCSLGFGKDRESKPDAIFKSTGEWYEIWKNIYDKYGSCEIHFTGGEPFCYPNFMAIAASLVSMHTFECSTNLYWDVDEFIKLIPSDRARIGTSYHPEMIDYKTFFNKTVKLKNAGYEVWVNYVAYPPFINDLEKAKKKFSNEGISMSILPFDGIYDGKNYPDEYTQPEREHLNKLGADLPWVKKSMDRAFNQPELSKIAEKKCLMGVMYAKIHPDGNVYRCCAEDPKKLGNLTDGTVSLLKQPELCGHEKCPCWKCMVDGEEENWSSHWVVPPAARRYNE